jgi:acetylglutamate kinase
MEGARADLLVIKLGGTTLAEQESTLEEVAALSASRRLLLVHGGGRRLTDWLDRLGIQTGFREGLRVTDEQSLEVAVAVLGGLVNAELVTELRRLGADAVGVTGLDGGLLSGNRQPDLGRVASVSDVRTALIDNLLAQGFVPVVAPLALDADGVICNVNADDAAAGLARALHARLVLLTDTEGVRDASGQPLADLDAEAAERLIDEGVIHGGMVPKVRSALAVVRAAGGSTGGSGGGSAGGSAGTEVIIADGRQPAALTRALEDPTFGTRITFGREPA